MVNSYSQRWFELFLETQQYTGQEVAFVVRHLPNPPYCRLLDVACGPGRHGRLLAEQGYEVVGIDVDEASLAKARRNTKGQAIYLHKDMRHLEEVPGSFDAVLSLWQSFGYFDEGTNREVVKQIGRKLKPKGRFILDIYHREYFEKHQGTRQLKRLDRDIKATNVMEGKRLRVRLEYGNRNKEDLFDWHLYTPEEIRQLAGEFGLRCLVMCTEFDEEKRVTIDKPRMNLVFERE